MLRAYEGRVPITFDPAKIQRNAEERGMPFEMAEGFDFDAARIRQDTRFPYPKRRFQVIGRIDRRTVMLVFTPTADGFRVISLRPAHRKERALWLASRP